MIDSSPPTITPQTTVGELLQRHPELEETLVALSPEFQRLNSPVLRATIAKVATLSRVARVGGLDVAEVVRTLRAALDEDGARGPGASLGNGTEPAAGGGCESSAETASVSAAGGATPENANGTLAEWLAGRRISATFDARPILAAGDHPLPGVMRAANALGPDGALDIVTPFDPAPLVDLLRERGFATRTERCGPAEVHTYVRRP